jgi:hypothetical protein
MGSFKVEVYGNGVVIIPLNLGGQAKVFEKDHCEKALLEMYHNCFKWEVGDKIKVERNKVQVGQGDILRG